MRKAIVFLIVVGVSVTARAFVRAQAPSGSDAKPLTFEVASVKPNQPPLVATPGLTLPADRLQATAVTLDDLIAYAYGPGGAPAQRLFKTQIARDQPWMNVDRFDVVAKVGSDTPVGAAGNAQKLLMLRQLLADRFKLVSHHETPTVPVYALALARADGKPGPDLHPSNIDCQEISLAGVAPPPTPAGGAIPCGQMVAITQSGALFRSGGLTMTSFIGILSRVTNRPVLDKTSLAGAFDIVIRFDTQGLEGVPTAPPSTGPRSDSAPVPLPSLFTVLQDQLGLKLTAERAPIDVIVVDHAEHPAAD